ncbi:hypothetical protein BK126_05200 [Paenibacillus sp. FSL H7-0326]|nr:hypothetical protein BK126_05200 [Paenibacillus sp. FSL H7-0326]
MISSNGRLGDPNEIAYLALFLASVMARFISGAAIPVDVGFMPARLSLQSGKIRKTGLIINK